MMTANTRHQRGHDSNMLLHPSCLLAFPTQYQVFHKPYAEVVKWDDKRLLKQNIPHDRLDPVNWASQSCWRRVNIRNMPTWHQYHHDAKFSSTRMHDHHLLLILQLYAAFWLVTRARLLSVFRLGCHKQMVVTRIMFGRRSLLACSIDQHHSTYAMQFLLLCIHMSLMAPVSLNRHP